MIQIIPSQYTHGCKRWPLYINTLTCLGQIIIQETITQVLTKARKADINLCSALNMSYTQVLKNSTVASEDMFFIYEGHTKSHEQRRIVVNSATSNDWVSFGRWHQLLSYLWVRYGVSSLCHVTINKWYKVADNDVSFRQGGGDSRCWYSPQTSACVWRWVLVVLDDG
jgi:hypothetical protein